MEELDVAMAIVRSPNRNFLALEKHEDYTDQDRYEENRNETAGGSIEDGETPVQAAAREVWEETRLRAYYTGSEEYPGEWSYTHERPDDNRRITFYPVPLEVDSEEVQLSGEHSDFMWYTVEEFERELPDHNVEGLKTVLSEF